MNTISAQTETPAYKSVADKFELLYNAGKYDSIFTMFATVMKNAMPNEKANAFLQTLKMQAGNINKREFRKYVNGSYASYKTDADKIVFDLSISIDAESKINGFFVKPFVQDGPPKIARNATKLILPFKGEWTVFWGGDTKEQNYHVQSNAQKNAFDILIFDTNDKTHKTDGAANEDYYAFGKELIAPCDGEVVVAVDGIEDNKPGVMNPEKFLGNHVIVKTENNEYLLFAHFRQQSVAVKQGQKVKQGQLLGLCGNSGNSSEPHLHFHIQDGMDIRTATGVPCFFEKIVVNGVVKMEYSPVKGDRVRNY